MGRRQRNTRVTKRNTCLADRSCYCVSAHGRFHLLSSGHFHLDKVSAWLFLSELVILYQSFSCLFCKTRTLHVQGYRSSSLCLSHFLLCSLKGSHNRIASHFGTWHLRTETISCKEHQGCIPHLKTTLGQWRFFLASNKLIFSSITIPEIAK